MKTLEDYIRVTPDFPKPGIVFRDISTLVADPEGMRLCVSQLAEPYRAAGIDRVAGLEARGFILGAALALELGKGFLPIRKKGKLSGPVIGESYALEYGEAEIEMNDDVLRPGERVLMVDDLLATGGTAEAGINLVERVGAEVVSCAFVVDLLDVGGRARLEGRGMEVFSLLRY
ncbi:adenine phosphoribosyltransferase [Pseudooceanicola marinus]|uniref:adenine phosphoribosyltransferase n=1 Tax=Pseudooceanicola marinus TaxID=396013 RepID=UPI001C985044|nr:adenine phosphoribosyltransferase [Pseudooceanicola marinus]MBY5972856.1 adenine phosphoribosyltransferase [Ferrimonas balearica]MCA1336712.1 adenine phosphoribosyltransferase [Pseudooceanicola marinus]